LPLACIHNLKLDEKKKIDDPNENTLNKLEGKKGATKTKAKAGKYLALLG
jgi:hypothetical protein